MSEVLSKLLKRLARSSAGADPVLEPALAERLSDPLPTPREHPPGTYLNREISDLQFIERVLEEARNARHPLLERLRFLAISADVLDQFYSVRVARLRRLANRAGADITPDGLTPVQQLRAVLARGDTLRQAQYSVWEALREELHAVGIALVSPGDLPGADIDWLQHHFRAHVLPLLTPCIVDAEHPFPFIPSGELCTVFEFPDRHILVPLPPVLPRFIALPGDATRFISLEATLFRFWPDLFPHGALRSHGVFQVLRDNELARQQRADDLRAMIESGLRLRHQAASVLLQVSDTMSAAAIRFVAGHTDLFSEEDLAFFEIDGRSLTRSGRVNVTRLPALGRLGQLLTREVQAAWPDLLFKQHVPRYPDAFAGAPGDCFDAISAGDVMVHWPYESFDSLVHFLQASARDAHVQAIKQTLYRTSDDSPVVDALIEAAEAGKAVTTVIELEARENESSNVALAKRLEAAGVQIIYGIVGLKIHMKATLVVRREGDASATYTHLTTGNYHPGNARIYTDLSLFTRDDTVGRDMGRIFNYITSGSLAPTEKVLVAPLHLRNRLTELIDQEIANARSGLPAHICIKVNSLTDVQICDKLYEASGAGVRIDLIVRRHCILRPGVEGLSENITVKSIVGRFLEHSRIYLFANGAGICEAQALVLVGSPDLMPRNLDERVETVVPVEDPSLRHRLVHEIVHANLADTRQSWWLREDGAYERHSDRDGFSAHDWLCDPSARDIGRLAP